MYPELVRFQWKKKNGETWADTAKEDGEVLELKSLDKSMTSMMITKTKPTNFGCSVAHEANRETVLVQIKEKGITSMFAALACTELVVKYTTDDKTIFSPSCLHLVQNSSVYYFKSSNHRTDIPIYYVLFNACSGDLNIVANYKILCV